MHMHIEIDDIYCTRSIYRAIGEFIGSGLGGEAIKAVHVFKSEQTEARFAGRVVPLESHRDYIGVVIEWDFAPDKGHIGLFRRIWDRETGLNDVVILHDSPSTQVDQPRRVRA